MKEQAIAIINQRIQDLKDCVMSDYIRRGIIENLIRVRDEIDALYND
jgi:hypothetical protein